MFSKRLKPLGLDKIVTVVGFGGQTSEGIVKADSEVVWQKEQKGTGHAVAQAAPVLEDQEGETIICCGDTPLLTTKTLAAMFSSHETNHNALTIMTAQMEQPSRLWPDRKREGACHENRGAKGLHPRAGRDSPKSMPVSTSSTTKNSSKI
jgi:CTP:molybdopterin cytidylyltransferase MocA